MICSIDSKAARRYQKTVLWEMGCYVVILLGVSKYVHRHHPVGWELYVLALLPLVPVFAVLIAVGVYLRDEKDEFQRDMMIRSLLWGTAGVLGVSVFVGFLRSFGWPGNVPPFLEFIVFWLLVAASKGLQRWTNRPPREEAVVEGAE